MPKSDKPPPDPSRGDPAVVFAELFDTHGPAIGRYLARRVGTRVAEDLVAETFVAALSARNRFDPAKGTVRVWLFGIATNLIRGHLREQDQQLRATALSGGERLIATDQPDESVPGRVDAAQQMSRLAGAIAALPPGDREVLLLTSWAGLDSTEVAAALDIPAGTVRSRLHRVRAGLKKALADNDNDNERNQP